MGYQKNCRTVAINSSAAGTTVLIAPGQLGAGMGTVKVWQVLLNGAGANVITFTSAGNPVNPPIAFAGSGASAVLQNTEEPWFKGLPGQGLSMTTTQANGVTGVLYYTLA